MKFSIQRETLLKPLQLVAGAAERKSTRAILANVLLQLSTHQLVMTATDTEVELQVRVTLPEPAEPGETTVPARKFIEICRNLKADSTLQLHEDNSQIHIRAGNSHFHLATLPANEFPDLDQLPADIEFNIAQNDLRYLLEATQFSMAHNDVRYYLNGVFLRIDNNSIHAVATDGHRLALCQIRDDSFSGDAQFIIPRKAVIELLRLLEDSDESVTVGLSQNHLRVASKLCTFTSKLINGRFPDYQRVIPKSSGQNMVIERDILKEALSRVSILSNEKYRGIRLQVRENQLRLMANNPEQEEAEEVLTVQYQGEDLDIGFNVGYILDVLSNISPGDVRLEFTGSKSSLLIYSLVDAQRTYVIMPMRV